MEAVSEIGIDMSRFPSAAHLISWACICPRNDESAGKRRSNRQRKGANWLKTRLVQCGLAAAKKKGSYLQAQFYRIKARRGAKKAIIAVVASILTAIYHMLKDGSASSSRARCRIERIFTRFPIVWLCNRVPQQGSSRKHCTPRERTTFGTTLAAKNEVTRVSPLGSICLT
jgi:transposase